MLLLRSRVAASDATSAHTTIIALNGTKSKDAMRHSTAQKHGSMEVAVTEPTALGRQHARARSLRVGLVWLRKNRFVPSILLDTRFSSRYTNK